MKIKFLMIGILGLISTATFAQKGELSTAQSELDKYQGLKSQPTLAKPSLTKAQEAIDKAAANEKTATMPLTWAVKASVYAALVESSDQNAPETALPYFNTASEALKKAEDLDKKGENKKWIDDAKSILGRYQANKGAKEFNAGKFDDAYKSFDYFRSMNPEDTTAMLYTAMAAYNAKKYPEAATNYSKLLATKYSKADSTYSDMVNAYLLAKDTAGAIKAIDEGLGKFPKQGKLRAYQIDLALRQGKQKEIIEKLNNAIAADPKNKDLYYYAGIAYGQVADSYTAAKIAKAAPAAKATMEAEKKQYSDKAAEMYKKVLELNPNSFEANLNLGFVYLSPAIDTYNAANKLPANKQKEYTAQVAKANAMFDMAKPYVLKAVELNPKSEDALNGLMTYYKGKRDEANAAKIAAQIKALQK
ncbi:tetratricopeptide repeat protein [Mucilaginibacter achroorhodeus]|uniref:Tetratricopeptide repeat protein n=1 Tax=Mucilaginibacter achroorhodeus TaxID=2599294 RepID=A0A563U420_9SPHI|nr:tetratricopeptide repeat protein [Mucilaginibacter achroorhodeus]TWR26097.1 tetratricopeptide repeat protein [Mucilaginibacter achroorhodeus]